MRRITTLMVALLAACPIAGARAELWDGSGHPLGTAGYPAFVQDGNNAAFQGEVAMVVGNTYAATRSLKANCTAAGNVTVKYPDGSSGPWSVQVGIQTIPVAAVSVLSSGTTATCTYSGLK